jgi:hypothetical protein
MRATSLSFKVCIIALPALLWSVGYGRAEEPSGSRSLELRLEIEKTALVLGEPVYATVRLVNAGTAPVEVSKLLDPQTGEVQIEVAGSAKPRFLFLPLFHADSARARMVIAPGEMVAAAFPVFYGALGWTLDRPGPYQVTARYGGPRGTQNERVRSNTVDVTVADDAGFGTALMNGSPASDEAGKFLLWQRGDHLKAGQALLTDLITKYPESPVAEYARLALGRNLSRSFRNYAVGQIRYADCPAALQQFQQVRSDRLPALLRIRQRLDEARCHVRLSQPAQAEQAVKRAHEVSGGRPEFSLVFQQARRLEPRLPQPP